MVKIDDEGRLVGDSTYRPDAAGFVIHGGIHEDRHAVGCVMHLHTVHGLDERTRLIQALGEYNVLALRNHGTLTAGRPWLRLRDSQRPGRFG